MGKAKTFILGAIFGCFLVTGVAFASEKLHLEVDVPQVSIWLDDRPLYADTEQDEEMELPLALEHSGTLYVHLPVIAEALGKEWKWDDESGVIRLETPEELRFSEVDYADLKNSLAEWVDESISEPLQEARIIEGETYLLITRGMKNTGGYDVEVSRIELWDDGLKVYSQFVDPKKGDLVTQGVTYPYVLVKVDGEYENVEFHTFAD